MEFKDLTKKDAQISLSSELDKLMMTSPSGIRDQVEQNMDGFKRLFGKFITSKGPSVQWERIEKLPHDAVSTETDFEKIGRNIIINNIIHARFILLEVVERKQLALRLVRAGRDYHS